MCHWDSWVLDDGCSMKHLPKPPRGFGYYRSPREVIRDRKLLPYQRLLLRMWKEMERNDKGRELTAVLTLNGIPTVYLCDSRHPVAPGDAAEIHRQFWNQGVATVLLLRDPHRLYVFSSMTKPVDASTANQSDIDACLVETINLAKQATWARSFYLRLATGQYYSGDNQAKFDPQEGVDAYLIDNLAAVRDKLIEGKAGLKPSVAHAFLGRVLFTCYLCDRGIIDLRDYFPNRAWSRLLDLLGSEAGRDPRSDLYGKLFHTLKGEFNGSMFDDDLDGEAKLIQPVHLETIRRFLNGDKVRDRQRSLGFWAYDFKFIPVETISAIYEDFLEAEGSSEKHESGAYYTPRFLAEMTLDLALENLRPLRGKRFLDPACGSGIFLVLLFNRLAAEWQAAQKGPTTPSEKARVLRELLSSLTGVDKYATACRIACFSLYLAFLDQFDPPGLRAYMKETGKKLPSLLQFADTSRTSPDLPVIWEGDFHQLKSLWKAHYHIVVGNPPWAGRGKKQIAHEFMEAAPDVLTDSGRACLLLPSKVFLNQTDAFQARWLSRVTLDKVVQLADYRFILFKEALCPCNIVRFTKHTPDPSTHEIEYVTPKVSRVDLRDGVIPVASQDRKWIPLRLLLGAAGQKATAVVWKSHLWGTGRDLKFLNFLFTLPRLEERVDLLSRTKGKRDKPWAAGQGCKPWKKDSKAKPDRALKSLGTWSSEDPFVPDSLMKGIVSLPRGLCPTLAQHLETEGYLTDKLYSKPDESLFTPPLVLFNQGFTEFGFFDFTVRFQHALQAVSGPDAEALRFLTAYMRSKLARYFIFHTSANIATERDKAHLFEVLRLPFFLPDSEAARPSAAGILSQVSERIRRLKEETDKSALGLLKRLGKPRYGPLFGGGDRSDAEAVSEWFEEQRANADSLQAELNPLIYEYFGLNEQEIALVEETCDVLDKSDTPPSLEVAKDIPTLQPICDSDLERYGIMLTRVLNSWATGTLRVSASGGVDCDLGIALVELAQTHRAERFKVRSISEDLANALRRLQDVTTEQSGHLDYLRGICLFVGRRIFMVKPAVRGQWTRIAALNDAADLYAHIAEARRLPE